MKILYFDCFSGISGDMTLGAFIDLGVKKDVLLSLPEKLNLEQVKIEINKVNKNGIAATKVDIIYPHEHVHRHLPDIEKIINNGKLTEDVKILAKKMFKKLAEAEANIHGTTIDKIHFHEVGALDAIFDIVGTASCFTELGIETAYVSKISVGGGMVKMAHGLYPVPAPATSFLLKGFPISFGPVEKELVTPTGAAILSALVNEPLAKPSFSIIKTGFGAGTFEHKDVPNVLRLNVGETFDNDKSNRTIIIETNIDDMNPQFFPVLLDKLLKAGASDAYLTPILMKKGRPAHTLSVLCDENIKNTLLQIIYSETTTIGARIYSVEKTHLKRKLIKVKTSFGEIQIKEITLPDNSIKRMPEFDDCLKIANNKNIPVKTVYEKIFSEINERV